MRLEKNYIVLHSLIFAACICLTFCGISCQTAPILPPEGSQNIKVVEADYANSIDFFSKCQPEGKVVSVITNEPFGIQKKALAINANVGQIIYMESGTTFVRFWKCP